MARSLGKLGKPLEARRGNSAGRGTPFEPFAKGDHLSQLIASYMERAHLPKLKKKRGMHSLRHTLASMLLENDTPLAVISDILGHTDTDSTAVYLKVDIKKLRECALDFERSAIDE